MEVLCPDKIKEEIERKRREMISSVEETGLLSVQTILVSQELDRLLNVFQEQYKYEHYAL